MFGDEINWFQTVSGVLIAYLFKSLIVSETRNLAHKDPKKTETLDLAEDGIAKIWHEMKNMHIETINEVVKIYLQGIRVKHL